MTTAFTKLKFKTPTIFRKIHTTGNCCFTSAQERISDLKCADEVSTADAQDARIEHGENGGWLAPVELEPKRKKVREKGSSRRASNKGCVFMSLADYLELLDWTGRQVKPGKRGSVARKVPPILDRLNLSAELWLQTIAGFGKRRSANTVTPAFRFNAAQTDPVRSVARTGSFIMRNPTTVIL